MKIEVNGKIVEASMQPNVADAETLKRYALWADKFEQVNGREPTPAELDEWLKANS